MYEMQHPMMGTPKSKFDQYLVCITHEVPIGEKQQFDQVERGFTTGRDACGLHGRNR